MKTYSEENSIKILQRTAEKSHTKNLYVGHTAITWKEKTHFEFWGSEQSVPGRFLLRFVSLPQSWVIRRKLVLQFPDFFSLQYKLQNGEGQSLFLSDSPQLCFLLCLFFPPNSWLEGQIQSKALLLILFCFQSRSTATRKQSQKCGRKEKLVSWSPADLNCKQARSEWCYLRRKTLPWELGRIVSWRRRNNAVQGHESLPRHSHFATYSFSLTAVSQRALYTHLLWEVCHSPKRF